MKCSTLFLLVVLALGTGCTANETQAPKAQFLGPSFYLYGDFGQTGRFPWTNGVTVIAAIHLGGGFTPFAGSKLFIHHADGTRQIFRRTSDGQFTNDVVLRPGDGVISPAGRIF